jgi:hypothetical protein
VPQPTWCLSTSYPSIVKKPSIMIGAKPLGGVEHDTNANDTPNAAGQPVDLDITM